ncbi:hypothetical protein [Streptomyces sp. NPDC058683]|uniref:hypothetical protein n=1 Tax=Streptomyces sp. NPDC058683 TaxID=3346597 RepID=UPI00365A699D
MPFPAGRAMWRPGPGRDPRVALGSALLALVVDRIAFDVRLPKQPGGYLLALLLTTVAALALGFVV